MIEFLKYICTMKKIIITLSFVLSVVLAFSQSISVATSNQISLGVKNEDTQKFDFRPFKQMSEVYIILDTKKIVVNSSIQQFYNIDSDAIELEDGNKGNYWYALDNNGTRCRLYLYMNAFSEIYLGVEYNDYAWIYLLETKN